MNDLANIKLPTEERNKAVGAWIHIYRNGRGPSAMAVILGVTEEKVQWYADWFQARIDAGHERYGPYTGNSRQREKQPF